ncbi:F-box domain-containing protein [Xylaria bambusicola]|uniref:F-box domain-containing protein n=1 Tax=Xylaria bambusicola TaxID=326684 RepID=UPI002007D64E|nr:F-box domain-containing protein [Xylaria bambusicola]KAI0520723.1 F-box domain-containing protein [Xylaria bambusicola]
MLHPQPRSHRLVPALSAAFSNHPLITLTPMIRTMPALVSPTIASNYGTKHRETGSSFISTSKASMGSLPTELHLLIAKHLTYPDALSLKHTSRRFFYLVDTGVKLKVAWLMERRSLHLECPNDRRCDLRSDLRFCRGSVKLLMQRRREHLECESRPGLGCLVFGTAACAHRQSSAHRFRRWLCSRLTADLWWFLLVLLPVCLGCIWATKLDTWPS